LNFTFCRTNPIYCVGGGEETRGLREARAGQRPRARGQELRTGIHGQVVGLLGRVDGGHDAEGHVVLQVTADRQILEHGDPGPKKVLGGPDAGHQEQVRGADHTRGQYHLFPGPYHVLAVLVHVLDTLHAVVQFVQNQSGRPTVDLHEQVGPAVGGPQVGPRGAHPEAVVHHHLGYGKS